MIGLRRASVPCCLPRGESNIKPIIIEGMKISRLVVTTIILLYISNSFGFARTITPSYYFVGKDKEFRTISSAIAKMNKGDICIVNEGIYREELFIDQDSIEIIGFGEVIVTGCDRAENLQTTIINGQKALTQTINYPVYDVFEGDKNLQLARYPNKTYGMTDNQDWLHSYIAHSGKIKLAPEEERLVDCKDGYYVGLHGSYIANPDRISSWYSISVPITGLDEYDSLIVNGAEASSGFLGNFGLGKGIGYIIASDAALDAKGEWYTNGRDLFLLPISEKSESFEFRVRLYGTEITGNGVTLSNIRFKAASAKVSGNGVSFRHCAFEYISPFQHNENDTPENKKGQSVRCSWGDPENGTAGVYVTGDYFTAKDCRFSKSWWSGMTLRGNNALIENCLFEDMNWIAKRCAALHCWGDNNRVRFCTFRNLGAAAIEGGNSRWIEQYASNNIWEYNYIKGVCKLVIDQGFFYVNHQFGNNPHANSIWRYNVGENSRGPIKGDWKTTTVGYYIDNSSSGYYVHNNIAIDVNEGFRYNDTREGEEAGRDIWIYNNTFLHFGHIRYQYWNSRDRDLAKPDAEVFLINNLAIANEQKEEAFHIYGELGKGKNNYEYSSYSSLKAPDKMNFTPVTKELANSGIPVLGREINYIGAVDPEKGMWIYGADESRLP